MPDPPRLVCIPSTDSAFAEHAACLLSELPPDLPLGEARAELERRLRECYPHAVVRPQEELAAIHDLPVWYVTNRLFRSRFSARVEVNVPIDVAFGIYVHRVGEWQTAFRLRPRRLPERLTGSEYDVVYRLFGRTFHGQLRLVAADPPSSLRFEAEGGGIRLWYLTAFRSIPGGTAIDVAGDYDLPNTFVEHVADRLGAERAIRRQIDHAHAAYSELCRREAGP